MRIVQQLLESANVTYKDISYNIGPIFDFSLNHGFIENLNPTTIVMNNKA